MEHRTSFTTKDGTEYSLAWDNETGDGTSMHYLLWEDDVLKLECTHHKLPAPELTEDEFKSSRVPLAFLNCLARTLNDMDVKRQAEEAGGAHATLAQLITPHVALEADQLAYVHSILERGHSIELFVQLQQELAVEDFARTLNSEPTEAPAQPDAAVQYEGQISLDGGKTFRNATPEELERLMKVLFNGGPSKPTEDDEDYVRPAIKGMVPFLRTYYPAIIFATLVVAGVAFAIFGM